MTGPAREFEVNPVLPPVRPGPHRWRDTPMCVCIPYLYDILIVPSSFVHLTLLATCPRAPHEEFAVVQDTFNNVSFI